MNVQGIATDCLADVIQVFQLGRKNGTLRVTRDDGVSDPAEQATVTLQHGNITAVKIGLLAGRDAYTKLMSWRKCYFVFQALSASDI